MSLFGTREMVQLGVLTALTLDTSYGPSTNIKKAAPLELQLQGMTPLLASTGNRILMDIDT